MKKISPNAPIGVFDSGVGGLTVILEMLQQLPQESYIYFADTAHVPYGPREPEELRQFADQITHFLVERGCKAVIIACNTSTSLAYDMLRQKYSVPLVGVIEPGVDKALAETANGKVGVFATQATVNSGAFQRLIKEKRPEIQLTAVACPLFVPLVEAGEVDGPAVYDAVRDYYRPLEEKGVDSLILGCTHYPFLLPVIDRIVGPKVQVINPARETVSRAAEILRDLGLLAKNTQPQHKYYVSGEPLKFRALGSRFLQKDLGLVKKKNLSNY
ncbi:MAG: glutamate racemase [Peptococcia bacterium]